MSEYNNIPDILMTSKSRGYNKLSIERLREISICLSNLSVNIELPILEVLIEQEDLQKPFNNYKSILLNCILDCIRLALPVSPNFLKKIKFKNCVNISNNSKNNLKQSNTEIICEITLFGLIEHIESILESLKGNEVKINGSNKIWSKCIYSIERATENNSKLLIFLIENIHESLSKSRLILIFDMLLDLLENSVIQKNIELQDICKYAISSILSYTGMINAKNELTLSFLKKLINLFKSSKNVKIRDLLFHFSAILSNVGVSGISYITNTILTESFKFLRCKARYSSDFRNLYEKENYWWRDRSALFPDLLKNIKFEKFKDIQMAVIDVIHFLGSINEEYIQSVISQMACEIRETNDKLRLETVKMVTKFILLDIKSEYEIVFQSSKIKNQQREFKESLLKSQLIEFWLSRLNDKQLNIRSEVFEGITEAMNILIEKSEFGYYSEKFIKFIIESKNITCPNMSESWIKFVSVWLANNQKESNSSKLVDNSIQYLIKHICDKNRNIRIYLIKYLKGFIKIPELSGKLWLLWYVSFKQKDCQMRIIIEDALLDLNQLEALESCFPINKTSETLCSKAAEYKSNTAIFKIIKTFIYQRYALLKNFRLFVCSLFLIQIHKNNKLDKYLDSLKLEIIAQIEYFFQEDGSSKEDSETAAKNMLSKIQDSLISRERFVKWAAILGIKIWHKEQRTEDLIEGLEIDLAVKFKKIIRYLSIFKFNFENINCILLRTIFCPNLDIVKEKLCNEYCNGSSFADGLDAIKLNLQFKFKINMLNYILNSQELSHSSEKIIQMLNDAIKLFDIEEIFKLYEGFYFNSKNLFRKKLMKYLREANSMFSNINEIFDIQFTDDCFSLENYRSNFITEIIPNNELGTIISDIVFQIFPNNFISNTLCDYSDFRIYIESNILKKKNNLNNERSLELFILCLQAEKMWKYEFEEITDAKTIISKLIIFIEKVLMQSDITAYQYILLTKLIGVGCLLCFKLSTIDKIIFSKFFDIYYNFNKKFKFAPDIESRLSKLSFTDLYLENKLFYTYFTYNLESSFDGSIGINLHSLKESILVFNLYFYFELNNYICLSELKDFYRENHLRLFELGQEFCNNGPAQMIFLMNSKVFYTSKDGIKNNILSTALGRSIGISFIPLLSQQLSKELESSKVYIDIERSISEAVNIFIGSVIYPKTIKYNQLYCVFDCIISVFLYYISKTNNFNLEYINNSIHCFVKIFYDKLQDKLKSYEIALEQLTAMGVYCIAFLEEIGSKYNYISDNSNLFIHSINITDICKGIQFHISYFFLNKEDPEIYLRENTDIFDNWNYIKSTYKFRMPSYLFSRIKMNHNTTKLNYIWNVPVMAQSKQIKEKEIKKNRSIKIRKLADPNTRTDLIDHNDENLVRKYYKRDSDSFSSSLSEGSDENWIESVPFKIGTPKKLRRSSRLKSH
ncbi:hypothetical protein [Cryptosporidium parvum Iowa II]|uniref:Uncharacterized protein n=2 Tax=Cryptosporidium parvum TaxID=5807 RepID=Q5CVM6_CRYPI|nr:hypothetical protein [Cryptosporidium parvum Iowa II]EAK89513.1 hypothetical protein cgd8_3500 [Cryptosporidium parvum Iowa II]QOY40115.1 Uncharacterized protein with Armadillo-like helical [Cryptosporidium parvum]WKS79610.1 hypothetical protein CPCDC_8g3500 [Cryptosporidium sp. 43IA8]WRK34113.1 Armadillo-like helical protein [Cryptosporidium parvum]|eukprot:QOY40115.1 hypothetical protein CPATCC_004196 [Cryptosporidium parvum]